MLLFPLLTVTNFNQGRDTFLRQNDIPAYVYKEALKDHHELCKFKISHLDDLQVVLYVILWLTELVVAHLHHIYHLELSHSQIASFMGPIWGPPGSCRPQMGPMLAPRTLLSGYALAIRNPDEIVTGGSSFVWHRVTYPDNIRHSQQIIRVIYPLELGHTCDLLEVISHPHDAIVIDPYDIAKFE